MKLTSEKTIPGLSIADIKRISIAPGEVLLIQLDFTNQPLSAVQDRMSKIGALMKSCFPNNKIIVLDKNVDISVITP